MCVSVILVFLYWLVLLLLSNLFVPKVSYLSNVCMQQLSYLVVWRYN